jgi:hypothetical protein
MIEIDALTKACGLSTFRYRSFPAPPIDAVAAPLISPEAEPVAGVGAAESPPATLRAAATPAEPWLERATPAPQSVLGEVAALSPAPAAAKSARPSRAARSAWRAATPAHQPR